MAIWQYGHIGKANIKGIETSLRLPISTEITLTTNYAYIDAERKSDDETYFLTGESMQGEPLVQTPKHKVNLKLDWQVSADLSTYVQGTYTGKQIWAASRNGYNKGPRYQSASTLFDIGFSYNVTKMVQINSTVYNLFNKEVDASPNQQGDWDVIEGRRLWIGMNMVF